MKSTDLFNKVNSLITKGLYAEAIELLVREKQNFLFEVAFYQYLAICYVKQDKLQMALSCLNEALELFPDNADLLSERGVVYFHLQKKSLALLDMENAVTSDPENAYRYSSRAYIKDSIGDLEGAISDYKKAISLDPNDAIAHNNLGMLQEKLGYQQQADKNFKKADRLAKDFDQIVPSANEDTANTKKEATTPQKSNLKEQFKIAGKVFTDKNTFREFRNFWRDKLFGNKKSNP